MDDRSRALRLRIVEAFAQAGRGHIASAFSLLEIVRVLYDDVLRYRATEPDWPERDRFVLSKGHGCLGLYVLLAEKGFFADQELDRVASFEALLGGHPEHVIPGVEASTGALGHGLSIAVGMALAARIDQSPRRVFALVGDGECAEGAIWEAAISANKHQLSNLTVLVDRNHFQCFGPTEEVAPLESLSEKWTAFGAAVRECDGHDPEALAKHLADLPFEEDRVSVLICHTVKGRGVPAMESSPKWHHTNKLDEDGLEMLRNALADPAQG